MFHQVILVAKVCKWNSCTPTQSDVQALGHVAGGYICDFWWVPEYWLQNGRISNPYFDIRNSVWHTLARRRELEGHGFESLYRQIIFLAKYPLVCTCEGIFTVYKCELNNVSCVYVSCRCALNSKGSFKDLLKMCCQTFSLLNRVWKTRRLICDKLSKPRFDVGIHIPF